MKLTRDLIKYNKLSSLQTWFQVSRNKVNHGVMNMASFHVTISHDSSIVTMETISTSLLPYGIDID